MKIYLQKLFMIACNVVFSVSLFSMNAGKEDKTKITAEEVEELEDWHWYYKENPFDHPRNHIQTDRIDYSVTEKKQRRKTALERLRAERAARDARHNKQGTKPFQKNTKPHVNCKKKISSTSNRYEGMPNFKKSILKKWENDQEKEGQ